MLKRIWNVWKFNLSELYTTILSGLGGWIFGVLLVAVVLHFDKSATSSAIMGTFMAVLVGCFINILMGIMTYGYSFNTAVSMGSTRKEFIIADGATAYINLTIEIAVVLILHSAEKALCAALYPAKECEDLLKILGDYRIVLGIILFVPAIRMFCGALILKFQKKAYWTLYALFMISFLGGTRFVDGHVFFVQIFNGICKLAAVMPDIAQIAVILVISCIFISGTVLLVRKQAVQA